MTNMMEHGEENYHYNKYHDNGVEYNLEANRLQPTTQGKRTYTNTGEFVVYFLVYISKSLVNVCRRGHRE